MTRRVIPFQAGSLRARLLLGGTIPLRSGWPSQLNATIVRRTAVHDFPDDADGDALRRVASDGSDMSKPMLIDFTVAAPDERVARLVHQIASSRGYSCQVVRNSDDSWDCICSITMLATHDGVIRVQRELDHLLTPLGARTDGWGTFGNAN